MGERSLSLNNTERSGYRTRGFEDLNYSAPLIDKSVTIRLVYFNLLLDILQRQEEFTAWCPDTVETRTLQRDEEIHRLYETHPDYAIFDVFLARGAVLGPRLLAAFGSDRARFSSAADILQFGGIPSIIKQSGNRSLTHWRYACNKFHPSC